MKVAIYIRVSTQEQVENYSIGAQRERLLAYCKAKGWDVFDEFVDGGYSGATMDRPALKRMLNSLDAIDAIVVYKLDRLSRSQRDTLDLIEEHFLKNKVDFVSITETLDTSTPFGKAMIGILSVFAQLERETIAERMRIGHIKRAEEGFSNMGGDYDPTGYKRQDGELMIVPEEAEQIQMLYDFYEQTHSVTKVQKKFKDLGYKVWRFNKYRRILSNRLYIGEVSFAGEYYKGLHEPIISKEQFDRIQLLLERHKGANSNRAKESLLSGLMTCGKCGESFVTYSSIDKLASGKKVNYRYYICRARRFPSEYPEKCMNKNWNSQKLESLIINEIKQISTQKQLASKKQKTIDYKALIQKQDEKLSRILNLYVEGNIDKEVLDKQVSVINTEKENLINKEQQSKVSQNEITAEQFNSLVIDLESTDFATRQTVIQKLIKQITIRDNDIEIEWNF